MSLYDLDTLVCTLMNRAVRKAFVEEAISFGHQPYEAVQMHSNVLRELIENYQNQIKKLRKRK